MSVTDHALLQLGKRYNIALSRKEFSAALAKSARTLYTFSGGTVLTFMIGGVRVYAVKSREDRIVTVLSQAQAFSDCPRAVFMLLITQGELSKAFLLRSLYRRGALPKPKDAQSAKYNRACDYVWNAFVYLDRAQRIR